MPQNTATRDFHFTRHADFRLSQRSGLTPSAAARLLREGFDVEPKTLSMDRGRVFWSVADQCAYLAIYNVLDGTVRTLMPAYCIRNQRFVGTPFTEHGCAGHPGAVNRVRRRHVRAAMIRQGQQPCPPFVSAPSQTAPPCASSRLIATARLSFLDAPPLTFRLGKTPDSNIDEAMLAELVTRLKQKLAKRATTWSAMLKSAVIELGRKGSAELEREISLDLRGGPFGALFY